VVLLECLRFLAARGGLHQKGLFTAAIDKRQLLTLKEQFESGRKALRGPRAAVIPPSCVANLLLLWLSALPEPLFPPDLLPALLQSYASLGSSAHADRIMALRCILKCCDAYVVEAIFPLFELLHHYWVNQQERQAALRDLTSIFSVHVFGLAAEHRAPPELADALFEATRLLIADYRPLFTQPYNFNRYEEDLARQEAAAAKRLADAAGKQGDCDLTLRCGLLSSRTAVFADTGSPLLTPRRVGLLSVFNGNQSPNLEEQLYSDELNAVVQGLLDSTVASAFNDLHAEQSLCSSVFMQDMSGSPSSVMGEGCLAAGNSAHSSDVESAGDLSTEASDSDAEGHIEAKLENSQDGTFPSFNAFDAMMLATT
jgi:hypothetical protein